MVLIRRKMELSTRMLIDLRHLLDG
ncbi:hypothetical protein NE237_019498 [Protea cynaroides]|uniref:Uncharacterized protein n=1 Tax=Protea cynaroides TaxID=273540 RepID=A0A9Q0GK35_9MAGN|nr:hypothetical protein NE237_019498 [Protea cynaroides]